VQVNIFEAKTRLSQLIKSVQAGEEVVIANRGEPVARLVPARETSGATCHRVVWLPTTCAFLQRLDALEE